MPDWRAIVEQQLTGAQLAPARRDAICCELASHLEDEFTVLRERFSEEEAQQRVLALFCNSSELKREIVKIEEECMTQTTRAVYVPGVVLVVLYTMLAVGLGSVISRAGSAMLPRTLLSIALPSILVIGAIGAGWAKAMGATRLQRMIVSVFPTLMPIIGILIVAPASVVLGGHSFSSAFSGQVFPSIINGVLIPALVLLLGALPFLRNGARSIGSPQV